MNQTNIDNKVWEQNNNEWKKKPDKSWHWQKKQTDRQSDRHKLKKGVGEGGEITKMKTKMKMKKNENEFVIACHWVPLRNIKGRSQQAN